MTHNSPGLKPQHGTGSHRAMTELTIPAGVGAAVKSTQLLEAGLRHKQIRRDTKISTPHCARLIEAKDLIELLASRGISGRVRLQHNPPGHQSPLPV
jgi:hypothetical protein